MLNFGDMLDTIDRATPGDRPALLHGERVVSWSAFARQSNNLAASLLAGGMRAGDKVAIYLRNCPEYLIALAAVLKAGLVPVNVNYRYANEELVYLLDNADARAVIHAVEFSDRIAAVRQRLPTAELWIALGDDPSPFPGTLSFATLAEAGDGAPVDVVRSPDDLFFLYTGGTTGLPKGVMWPQGDLRELLVAGARAKGAVPDTLDDLAASVRVASGARVLPAPPLMHGTGLMVALNALVCGGSVVTLTSASFDAIEMLEAIALHRPRTLIIVGDSFGRPLLEALDANPGRYDLTSVEGITSSGVMWSVEVKRGLLRHMPHVVLNDVLSSSEALGLGTSVMTADGDVPTARFAIGSRCRVIDEDGNWVTAGSGKRGLLALAPPNPVGYYKDPEKSAATFREIDGQRYCIPGDWCEVAEDGAITFLGRGNACINTAGEKVFPEEVEEVLKRHEQVEDALVVGVPDPKWGQAIVAVIEVRVGHDPAAELLRDHVRAHLSGYKVPKAVVRASAPLRAANGKADYGTAREQAIKEWNIEQ